MILDRTDLSIMFIKDVILKLSFPQSLSGNPEIRNRMPDKELWHDGKYSNNYVSK
jgi:hypothetical protein